METIETKFINALAKNDHQSSLHYLNAGLNILYINPDTQWTLLNYAIEHENLEIIEKLLKLGVDVNYASVAAGGWGAVHHATESAYDFFVQNDSSEPDTKILELILLYSPDLTRKDSSGRVAMDYAKHDKLQRLLSGGKNNDRQ